MMNLRLFSIAILISALPLSAGASVTDNPALRLNHGDFVAAERTTRDGEKLVVVKLSKSGRAKLKKLSADSVGQSIHSEIGGVNAEFKLNVPVEGDSLETGLFKVSEADRVVSDFKRL